MKIPNEYHFIWGLSPRPREKPFSMIHYIAVASCISVNSPERINLYYTYEPEGFWWERTRPLINATRVPEVSRIFGKTLDRSEHRSDVLRLVVLLDKGGIYLDLDVICIKPFSDLLSYSVVLGEELGVGLCNAVILAEPNARFIEEWLQSYATFDAQNWNEHSVKIPLALSKDMAEVHVLDHRKFFWPMYGNHGDDLRAFILFEGTHFCAESYCVHLWAWFTSSFIEHLTPEDLWSVDSEFFLLARKYIDISLHSRP